MDSRAIRMDIEHRTLHGNHIEAPTKVLIYDPCPFGQLRILTVAHLVRGSETSKDPSQQKPE